MLSFAILLFVAQQDILEHQIMLRSKHGRVSSAEMSNRQILKYHCRGRRFTMESLLVIIWETQKRTLHSKLLLVRRPNIDLTCCLLTTLRWYACIDDVGPLSVT